MTLKTPNLDDRSFEDLRREAFALIEQHAPQWTDRSPSDPGVTLLEVFAHLTEVLIYRVNRMPEKAHFALLNLLGVGPLPPAPAEVTLTFKRTASGGDRDMPELAIPAGTIVSDRGSTVSFFTTTDVVLPAQAAGADPATVDVLAVNAERIEGEALGISTGQPGQAFTVKRGPILRRPSDPRALVVAVEALPEDPADGIEMRDVGGKPFAIWREVASFAGLSADEPVYAVDRATGSIAFGAGAAGRVPPKGRTIRAWYLRGGGRAGNVEPGRLTSLQSPIRDVTVENRARGSGGEDIETIDQALVRGRESVRVLRSAVTARDFENIAAEVPGIARARAFAQRDVWNFGRPGVVDVLVVPRVGVREQPDGVTTEVLTAHQTHELIERTRDHVRRHRPVGVESRVEWAKCRAVDISARVFLTGVEDRAAAEARLVRRLHELLAPDGSWPFGRPLRASDVYEALLTEPGFRYAENLTFTIADAPQVAIKEVHRDQKQPTTFYAAGKSVFRSLGGPDGWAMILARPDEVFLGVRTATALPGWVAAFGRSADESQTKSLVYVSDDGGENWGETRSFPFEVRDVAFVTYDNTPVLLVAGRTGLQQIRFSKPSTLDNVPVRGTTAAEKADDARGFDAIATAQHVSGLQFVAISAREQLGIYVAAGSGKFTLLPNTQGAAFRTLAFQQVANETFLWAGFAAEKGEPGKGAMRIGMRIDGSTDPTGWQTFSDNWKSGSCEALDFFDDSVAAGTNRGGVLFLKPATAKAWSDPPPIDCGLPLVDERRNIAPTYGVAQGSDNGVPFVLAGGDDGTFISRDGGRTYRANGRTKFEDRVPLPRNWLFCSGKITLALSAEAVPEG